MRSGVSFEWMKAAARRPATPVRAAHRRVSGGVDAGLRAFFSGRRRSAPRADARRARRPATRPARISTRIARSSGRSRRRAGARARRRSTAKTNVSWPRRTSGAERARRAPGACRSGEARASEETRATAVAPAGSSIFDERSCAPPASTRAISTTRPASHVPSPPPVDSRRTSRGLADRHAGGARLVERDLEAIRRSCPRASGAARPAPPSLPGSTLRSVTIPSKGAVSDRVGRGDASRPRDAGARGVERRRRLPRPAPSLRRRAPRRRSSRRPPRRAPARVADRFALQRARCGRASARASVSAASAACASGLRRRAPACCAACSAAAARAALALRSRRVEDDERLRRGARDRRPDAHLGDGASMRLDIDGGQLRRGRRRRPRTASGQSGRWRRARRRWRRSGCAAGARGRWRRRGTGGRGQAGARSNGERETRAVSPCRPHVSCQLLACGRAACASIASLLDRVDERAGRAALRRRARRSAARRTSLTPARPASIAIADDALALARLRRPPSGRPPRAPGRIRDGGAP